MTDEEEDRLNFYSKYNRVKGRQDIDTLYSLIDNNQPTEIHILNVQLVKQQRESRANQNLKYKNSKYIIPKQILGKENEQSQDEEYDQINYKLQKLKRLERQFHEEMDRRERNLKKKRQQKQQQQKQQEKYKDQLINVVELKPSNTSSLKSSQLKSKKNGSLMQEVIVDNEELDFQDYYRQVPQVQIYSSYIANNQKKKPVRQKLEQHQNRQAFVESVEEEERKPTDSIIIGRATIGFLNINTSEDAQAEPNKNVEVQLVQLTHSQSLNVFAQARLDKEQLQSQVIARKTSHETKQCNQGYSPARYLNSIEEHIHSNDVDYQKFEFGQTLQKNQNEAQKNNQQQESFQEQQEQENNEMHEELNENYMSEPLNLVFNNHTATQEGQSLMQEFQDRVGSIINRSDYRQQNYNDASVQPTIFHSQTLPNQKNENPKELLSAASESLDYHPLQSPSEADFAQKLYENKKSSFKKLMADNRANLVPRMAISTILNEHINEALTDLKQVAHPVVTPLHESIISSESLTPIIPSNKRKRVNFKQKIVQQQLNKSYSREGRPAFERDQLKAEKNRGLLINFFAEN